MKSTYIALCLVFFCIEIQNREANIEKVTDSTLTLSTVIRRKEDKMYTIKTEIKPSNLIGISDEQINDHWKLYEGYVKNVNQLDEDLKKLEVGTLIYADRRRRYGFEYNGMVLHEYYFSNLISKAPQISSGPLKEALVKSWGSFENWKKDFIAAGKTRGIGWAILYCDPTTKRLTNNFVALHQIGNIAGYKPILVMDVWEHAYMNDHNAGGRGKYIEAFFQNINWPVVEKRFEEIK